MLHSLNLLLFHTHSELMVLFQKIAEQDGGRYEMAVYALQCSNLKRVLPICTDWEVCSWFNVILFFDCWSVMHFFYSLS